MELLIISILVLLGALLLTLEVALIPGFGVTGVLGIISLLASVLYAFWTMSSLAGWVTLLIVIAVVVVLIFWAIYGKSIDKVALKENINSTVKSADSQAVKVGDTGIAVTRLALVGEVDFDGIIIEVSSASGFIEENTPVSVVRISGGVIFVKSK